MKILYAATDHCLAKIQLARIYPYLLNINNNLKIAAYKISSPKHLEIDWTLDALLKVFNSNLSYNTNNNQNFEIYYEQVKSFKPDLIISDMEYYTSYIGNILNIPVIQCSSLLLFDAILDEDKKNTGIYTKYSSVINKYNAKYNPLKNIIINSEYNFVYSHFGDLDFKLKTHFEWIRPYHLIGKKSIKHNIVSASSNKKIINILKKYKDSIIFSEFLDEKFNNITLKDINHQEEFINNLKNSNIFVCEGETSYLADAYYNNKFPLIFTNFNSIESILNTAFAEKYGLAKAILFNNEDLLDHNYNIKNIDNSVPYLHEKIKELF